MKQINLITGIITVIEIVTLVGGLVLGAGNWYVIGAVWFIGILLEEVVRYALITGRLPSSRRAQGLLVLGVGIETVGWLGAFLPSLSLPQRIGILFVALTAEHAIIRAALGGPVMLRGVLDFSAVEAVGGAIWAADPTVNTVIVMTVTSVLEHVQGIRQGLGLRV